MLVVLPLSMTALPVHPITQDIVGIASPIFLNRLINLFTQTTQKLMERAAIPTKNIPAKTIPT